MHKYRLTIANVLLLLAVLGGCWARHVENVDADVPRADFLKPLRLPFRDWKATDVSLAASDRSMLQPDAVLLRCYRSPGGQKAELAVVAGHRKRTVHTPAFCMAGGGWETLTQRPIALPVAGRTVTATQAVMVNEAERAALVTTYFFTDGSYTTDSLLRFQGVEIARRFTDRVPMGALVRIRVPITTTDAAAAALTQDFARATLPDVLARLRGERLHIR